MYSKETSQNGVLIKWKKKIKHDLILRMNLKNDLFPLITGNNYNTLLHTVKLSAMLFLKDHCFKCTIKKNHELYTCCILLFFSIGLSLISIKCLGKNDIMFCVVLY